MTEPIETAPAMELTPQAIDNLAEALREYHAISSPLFQRREQREWAEQSLHGLLRERPRKSIEPMVLVLEGANAHAVRTLQLCISAGAWEDGALLKRPWQAVAQALGEAEGGLTLDGSDFLTQGQESVGVKRPYGGAVGQRANCPAGGSLGSASRKGYTLRDRRLSRPPEWIEEEAYAERRRTCGVPADIPCKTKPTLGGERIQAVPQAGGLRCRWVTGDEAFGRATGFLEQVAGLGLWDVAEGPHATPVWRQRPATAVPGWSGRGRKPTRAHLVVGAAEAATVVAAALPAQPWSRHTIKEGRKGPLVADCAAGRGLAVRQGLPGPEVWLVLRRHGLTGELKTSLRNAPADTPLATLVRLSGMRWPIETCCADGKQSLGMGDDEVRSWRGWHHHMTRCILAHFFLGRVGLRLKKKRRA